MSERKTRSLQKSTQSLLILLFSFTGSLLLPQGVLAEQSNTMTFPPTLVQSWKDYLKNYPVALAQYQKEQEKVRQAAKPVAASEEKNIDDLMKTYPFLQKDLQSAKDIQQSMAESVSKSTDPSLKQSLDARPHLQMAEDKDSKSGINLFFLGKSGRLWCSAHGCPVDVYVDTGTGYQKAGSFIVSQSVYITRMDKNVFLFAAPPENPQTVEWILKDHKFVEITPPAPEPKSQAFVEWRQELQQAGQWPPK